MHLHGSVILLLVFVEIGLIYMCVMIINRDKTEFNTTILDLTYKREFGYYLKEFNKKYDNKEYFKRLQNFRESLEEISQMNADPGSLATYGLTQFSDMSKDEFRRTMLMDNHVLGECIPLEKKCTGHPKQSVRINQSISIPAKIDWRKRGAIGPVIAQYKCADCWAISVVGVMEAMVVIQKLGPYSQLSVKELAECSTGGRPCNLNNVAAALKYLCSPLHPIGMIPVKKYPRWPISECPKYNSGVKLLSMNVSCDIGAQKIKELLAVHPVAVAVDALNWRNYLGGIIQNHCSGSWGNLNHVVQLVGYDTTGHVPYFLAKNSWGKKFGNKGYLKIAMGDYVCGVGRQVSYLRVYKQQYLNRNRYCVK